MCNKSSVASAPKISAIRKAVLMQYRHMTDASVDFSFGGTCYQDESWRSSIWEISHPREGASARGRHLIVITAVFPASIKDSSFQLSYPHLIL